MDLENKSDFLEKLKLTQKEFDKLQKENFFWGTNTEHWECGTCYCFNCHPRPNSCQEN